MNTDAFVKFPKLLMQSSHWVSLTSGEFIVLTPMQKIIWLHIKDRHDFFVSQGLSWFESQQVIADALCCNRGTVLIFLELLEKHGYIEVTRRIVRGCQQSNSYAIVADLQVTRAPKKTKTKVVATLPVVAVPVLLVDEEDPFQSVWEKPTPGIGSHAGNSHMGM